MSLPHFSPSNRPNDAGHRLREGAGTFVVALGRWVLESAGTTPIALGRDIRDGIVRWHRRRRAIQELSSLDDRMLWDIGLRRAEIPSVVEELVGGSPRFRLIANADARRANVRSRTPAIAVGGSRRNDPRSAAKLRAAGCG